MTYQLKLYPDNLSLCEIFQSLVVKFAFVNEDGQQVQKEAKCRDFLGDVVWCHATDEEPYEIYGSEYDPNKFRWDSEVTRMSLKFPNDKTKDNFMKNFHQFQELERKYGIPESVCLETQYPLRVVVVSDKVWQSHEWKVSYYSFLLKILCYPTVADLESPESKYYKVYVEKQGEEYLMGNLHKVVDDHKSDIYDAHNNSGFYSILNNEKHAFRKFFS
jgi:hypothetical protein